MTPLDTIQAPFKALANTGIFLSLTLYHSGKDLSKLIASALEATGPYFIAAIAAAHIVVLPIALLGDCIFAAPAFVSGAKTAYNAKDTYYPLESNPKQSTSSPSKSKIKIEESPSDSTRTPSEKQQKHTTNAGEENDMMVIAKKVSGKGKEKQNKNKL